MEMLIMNTAITRMLIPTIRVMKYDDDSKGEKKIQYYRPTPL